MKIESPASAMIPNLTIEKDVETLSHSIETQKKSGEHSKIKELANEFEALFLDIMVRTMRQSVQKSGFIDGGNAEEIYRSMLDTEYSKNMAAQRTSGIADAIEKQLMGLTELKENSSQNKQIAQKAYSIKAAQGLNFP